MACEPPASQLGSMLDVTSICICGPCDHADDEPSDTGEAHFFSRMFRERQGDGFYVASPFSPFVWRPRRPAHRFKLSDEYSLSRLVADTTDWASPNLISTRIVGSFKEAGTDET